MSFHGSDSALGSSNLYLDGIPFKIGEKFKRPPKVTVPDALAQADVTAALTEDYSFSTEEAVLAWLEDVRQAEEAKRQEDLLRAEREADTPPDDSVSSGDDTDQTEVKEISDFNWGGSATGELNSTWSNPVLANLSSDLLKPTPFACSGTPVVKKTTTAAENDFDIRSFDKVDDPFDNLELQVIDDLEELKSVLQSSQPTLGNGYADHTQTDTDTTLNTNTSAAAKVTLRKNAVKLKRGRVENARTFPTSASVTSFDNDSLNQDDDSADYINMGFDTKDLHPKKDNMVPNQLPPLELTAQRHSVALPPLRTSPNLAKSSQNDIKLTERSRPSSNSDLELTNSGQSHFRKQSGYENVLVDTSTDSTFGSNVAPVPVYSRHSISADYVNVASINKPVPTHPGQGSQGVNTNGLRGTKSTPSLLCSEDSQSVNNSQSYSPPSRPSAGQSTSSDVTIPKLSSDQTLSANKRHSPDNQIYENVPVTVSGLSTTSSDQSSVAPPNTPAQTAAEEMDRDLHIHGRTVGRSTFYENVPISLAESAEESWNKYTPLPPPKAKNTTIPPVIPPKSSKCDVSRWSPSRDKTPLRTSMDSDDPYSSLSIEAQAFVNSLTGMGFPRPRAARAVLKLGQDHKLVVEHLCLINSMVEKGYTAPLSEMALHLFTNDFDKAVKYLDLYLQFQELGFQKEKIREALVQNDIDRDKALDYLTA